MFLFCMSVCLYYFSCPFQMGPYRWEQRRANHGVLCAREFVIIEPIAKQMVLVFLMSKQLIRSSRHWVKICTGLSMSMSGKVKEYHSSD